jgi:hydroxymethylpyrimidine/phosphomethylpyrimidine kinase
MTARAARPRIALTIAGSDPSGGAGIQGDLRTFAAFDVHGLSAITCLTVQGTRGVRAVEPVAATLVRAQIETVLADVATDVVKTGALASDAVVRVVVDVVRARPRVPLVVDPVVASSSGAPLLDPRGLRRLVDALLPRATVVTPNLDELALLLGVPAPRDVEGLAKWAMVLRARTGAAVLAKGGHLRGAPTDVLVDAQGTKVFEGKRITTRCTHGTGCTLASAIAARLACGDELGVAVARAKAFVERALRLARPIGPGKSPLAHLEARLRTGARSPSPRR